MKIEIVVSSPRHAIYAPEISQLINESAKARGTGIAQRPPEYFTERITKGNAVLALVDSQIAGFCCIEEWGNNYVANSGLIVSPNFRGLGLAKQIKQRVFQLTLEKYPDSKLFTITTSAAVMKMNSELGYQPTVFADLPQDEKFWDKCRGCANFDILTRTERKYCLCTALVRHTPDVASKTFILPTETDIELQPVVRKKRTGVAAKRRRLAC